MGGFNLPPGCSVRDLPGNGPEFCELCGVTNLDLCICPECPQCGAVGDINCYPAHGLALSQAQIRSAAAFKKADQEANEQEAAMWDQYRDEMSAQSY